MSHGPDHRAAESDHETPESGDSTHVPESTHAPDASHATHPEGTAAHPTGAAAHPTEATHTDAAASHPTEATSHHAAAASHPPEATSHHTAAASTADHPAEADSHHTTTATPVTAATETDHPTETTTHPTDTTTHPTEDASHTTTSPHPAHDAHSSHTKHTDHGAHDEHASSHSGHGHDESMWSKFSATMTTTAKNTWDTLVHIDDPNHDPIPNEAKEVSGWMTPVAMTKSMIRGSVTNVLKRSAEIVSPLVDAGEAAFHTITSPILHPIETADNFKDYLSHPKRIITATARAVKNVLKAPFTLANEAYQGIVQRPLEQLNHKIKKIPVIGPITSWVSNSVAKVVGWPLKFMDRKAKEWTAWIDEADERTKSQQAGHLTKTNYAPVPATLAIA